MSFFERVRSDGVAYGPLTMLPLIVMFLSGIGHSTSFVRYAAIFSLAGIMLVALLIRKDRPSPSHMVLSIIAAAIVTSVAVTHWPLRLGFNLAERRLDELANVVFSGAQIGREWAGWYPIIGGKVEGSKVYLEIGGFRYEDCAFVRIPFDEAANGYILRSTWVHCEIENSVADGPSR
jgi:hypothetical protein